MTESAVKSHFLQGYGRIICKTSRTQGYDRIIGRMSVRQGHERVIGNVSETLRLFCFLSNFVA